ncbi:hypothetical protein BH20ACT2_BH20ACT2_11570 [soil metagenome]
MRPTDTHETSGALRHVVVSDEIYGLPFSKGLMASSIMATGLAPARAFHVAEIIENRLHENDMATVTHAELTCLALAVLRDEVGETYADSYAKWQTVKRVESPLIILLGGAPGVGKSTIATMLANRLGITRVIPTDAIREVMRAMFSTELLPTLQCSSFETSTAVHRPLPPDTDAVIAGFREQVAAVSVGVEALIARAVDEGTNLILEGAHVVPGFADLGLFAGRAVVVPMVIAVDDTEAHRSHFVLRGNDLAARPPDRYLSHFEDIRRIQGYLRAMADSHGVPVVPSYSLDATLSHVIDVVVTEAIGAVREPVGATGVDQTSHPSAASPAHAERRGTP